MATHQTKRKLAAVLAADIAGYSRLMGADEESTLARLKLLRRELIDPKNKQHRGRIVKTTGDGILIEFPSVVDAVRCAIEVQQGMVERNADVPQEKRIVFRVGVNLGDVMIEGRDLYGDGVNIAARLEALAEPGGICISRTVLSHARDKAVITSSATPSETNSCSGSPLIFVKGSTAIDGLSGSASIETSAFGVAAGRAGLMMMR